MCVLTALFLFILEGEPVSHSNSVTPSRWNILVSCDSSMNLHYFSEQYMRTHSHQQQLLSAFHLCYAHSQFAPLHHAGVFRYLISYEMHHTNTHTAHKTSLWFALAVCGSAQQGQITHMYIHSILNKYSHQ